MVGSAVSDDYIHCRVFGQAASVCFLRFLLSVKIAIRCKLSHLSAAFFEGLFGGYQQKIIKNYNVSRASGGSGGIRTHGTVPRTLVFKTRALNHSATLPCPVR